MSASENSGPTPSAPRRSAFRAGDTLWRKGDTSDFLYLIVSGTVALFHVDEFGNETRVAEFGPDQTVGEAALYGNEPRSTTVKAIENVDAVATDGNMLRSRIAGFDKVTALIVDSLLAKMKLMATTLDERLVTGVDAVPDMDEILAATSDVKTVAGQGSTDDAARRSRGEKKYRAGDVLWRKGDPSDYICLIASGTVAMYAVDIRGEESLIANLGRHDLVGENALYDSEPRSTTVYAVDDVEVLETDGRDLRARIAKFDSVSASIIQNLLVKMKIMAAMLDRGQEVIAATRHDGDMDAAPVGAPSRRSGARGQAAPATGGEDGSPSTTDFDLSDDDLPRPRNWSRLIAVFLLVVLILGGAVLGSIGWRGGFTDDGWIGRLVEDAKGLIFGAPSIVFLGSSTEMVVINEAVMYAQPSSEATVISPLRVGSRIEVRGQSEVDGEVWFRIVRRNGRYGYVPKHAFIRR